MKRLAVLLSLVLVTLPSISVLSADSAQVLTELTVEKIMRDPLWVGRPPSGFRWSPDSRLIYFTWNPERIADGDSLYSVSYNGGAPIRVSEADKIALPESNGDWSHKRDRLLYEKDGDLYIITVKSGQIRRLTHTTDWETNPAFTKDETAVLFTQGQNLFRLSLDSGELEQLTNFIYGEEPKEEEKAKNARDQFLADQELTLIKQLAEKRDKREKREQADKERELENRDQPLKIYLGKERVSLVCLSSDERYVVYALQKRRENYKQTIIPDYVTESGYTDSFESREKVGEEYDSYRLGIYDRARDTVYYAVTDSVPGIFDQPDYLNEYAQPDSMESDSSAEKSESESRSVFFANYVWSEYDGRLICDLRAYDHKDRWLALVDLTTGELTSVERQHDDAWIGGPAASWWSSESWGWLDGATIWFLSEKTGYSHLYTLNVDTGERRQWTEGDYEVRSVSLSPDKSHWYFISNEEAPYLRSFYRLNTRSGKKEQITDLGGCCSVTISPDYNQLAINRSYVNQPCELYVQANRPRAKATRVTYSQTEEWLSYPWRDPEVITFTARDSATVYAHLYSPKDPSPNAPAVIFVHGAGYLQNVLKQWGNYWREFMFHNLLTDRGYYVLDIDYRGSAGYGRDWRTGIYRHMGGKDLTDQVDGARYLVEQHGVDPERVGIYGGSYGGFITLMAMFTEQETFAAGAALRSVTDWAHYNHGYTSNILNTPALDSIAYKRSSPIYFAEGLEGDLLICHGVLDDNVHFQDVVRLAQRLIELGKDNWELAIYPLERHTFVESHAWTDEYKRILKLFETKLRNK